MEADKQEKTDNELIAEFMGGHRYDDGTWRIPNEPKHQRTADLVMYQHNWDWLMPVVEKINHVFVQWSQTRKFKEMNPIYRKLQNELIFCSLSEVHVWVLEFIKWYNSQKPLPL